MRRIRIPLFTVVTVAGLLALPSTASADLIDFTGVGRHLSNISITVNGQTNSVVAGELNWTWLQGNAAGQNFVSYCVDAATYLQDNQWVTVEETNTLKSAVTGAKIAFLFNTFAASVSSNLQAAALQIAIWEALYDSGQNLGGGAFRLNSTNASLITQVNSYLHQLYTSDFSDSSTTWLNTSRGQDQVTRSVPEPATLLLMAGALSFLARRLRSKPGTKA